VSSITIELEEEQIAKLTEIAERFGLSVEELARLSVQELLTNSSDGFDEAADYVLRKNEDLYKRLA
jgi:antitoxin FitA